jgi:predicted nucleic acid-binding protein
MPTPGNSLLLDTSVVVKHFRYPTAVVNKLAEYEELYLPQPALGELYTEPIARAGSKEA